MQHNSFFEKFLFSCLAMSLAHFLFAAPFYEKFFLNGLKQLEQQQYDEAVKSFTLYLSNDSTNALAYYNRAIAYKKSGDNLSAVNDLERVLELDPADTSAQTLLARCLYEEAMLQLKQQDTALSLSLLERYLKLNPADDVSWFNYGIILSAYHDQQGALESFGKAIALNPQPEYYLGRAIEYFVNNHFESALADLNHTLSLAPSDTTALWLRAQIFFYQKKNKAAQNDLVALLNQKPDFDDARLLLNEINFRIFLGKNFFLLLAVVLLAATALYFGIRAFGNKNKT
jgi:tetratricopeptide (TPR) repeat protein